MKTKQTGFTLVEIAIVLVIIGLLLGGVLKGQEMIFGAKIKNAVSDLNSVTSASNSYTDRYRRLAGDDGPIATLTARGGPWGTAGITAGGNNSVLGAAGTNPFGAGAGTENVAFWQHLRAAGLITGNAGTVGVPALPTNAFSGLTGVTLANANWIVPGNVICMSKVPGKAAAAIDAMVDDGVTDTGTFTANGVNAAAAANTAPGAATAPAVAGTPGYIETSFYTACRTL